MKKILIIGLFLIVMLTGCANDESAPKKGDFTFELPDGYSVSNVMDDSCSIVRTKDSAVVGEIEITTLKLRDLNDSKTRNILLYLQSDFHKTNNIEFISSHWGDEHPVVSVKLTKIDDDTAEKHYFSHVFFEKSSCVYHMWFDLDVIEAEQADKFISIAIID